MSLPNKKTLTSPSADSSPDGGKQRAVSFAFGTSTPPALVRRTPRAASLTLDDIDVTSPVPPVLCSPHPSRRPSLFAPSPPVEAFGNMKISPVNQTLLRTPITKNAAFRRTMNAGSTPFPGVLSNRTNKATLAEGTAANRSDGSSIVIPSLGGPTYPLSIPKLLSISSGDSSDKENLGMLSPMTPDATPIPLYTQDRLIHMEDDDPYYADNDYESDESPSEWSDGRPSFFSPRFKLKKHNTL